MGNENTRIFRNPQFDALRAVIYHADRHAFLEMCDRLLKIAIIGLGASVVSKATAHWPLFDSAIEVLIVFLGTVHLVFDFGVRAKTHEMLKKMYVNVLEYGHNNENKVGVEEEMANKLLIVSSEEQRHMYGVDAVAFNLAVGALGFQSSNKLKVSRWVYLTRNIAPYRNSQF